MGSFKRNGRNQGPDRRRQGKTAQRRGFLNIETLEGRTLMSVVGGQQTSPNLFDVQHGPMANEGGILISVYAAYHLHNVTSISDLAKKFPLLQFSGNSVPMVAISVNGTGDFNTFVKSLTNLGFKVGSASTTYGMVEGDAPIASLPQIAQLPQVLDASPIEKPQTRFVGAANNEGETALNAAAARQQFKVDGTGVTIGVLSDSVSQFKGGLADSYKTLDLNPNAPVKVLQDGPGGSTDEGRAMLENIHDIAPGAALQFATADGGQLGFANNIQALANAGSKVIVDDVGYFYEPFFQDGVISQAVNSVVAKGSTYFSAAGNTADQGYLSDFRKVSATVPTLGAGTYMNFNPTAGGVALTQLPITVGQTASANNPAIMVFQSDQPFATQEPAGSTATPTSEVDFYVFDSNGKLVTPVDEAGNPLENNNVATRDPIQETDIPAPGNYTVVIKVVSGNAPGHVEFKNDNENVNVTFPTQFGTGPGAGNTYYVTTDGHSAAANTIGVGAVPWWDTPAYTATYAPGAPLNSEPFSSFGPVLSVFNPDGTPKAKPALVQEPVVSGTDGGNTSFFSQGFIIDTSSPPFPGQPATPTNLSQNLPSFFGTSSAAPNVAAIATLMLQKTPTLTPAQIRSGLIASTVPLNGASAGTWTPQAGFGLVDAVKAINNVGTLTVFSTTPSNSLSPAVTPAPSEIDVTFDRPVDFSTVSAADLVFTKLPVGVASVTVGTPIALDDPKFPTKVAFPITVNLKPGQTGNGEFDYTIQGPIVAQDGKLLTTFNGKYNVNDVTSPHVIGVKINGRVVSIQFDKALAPTINNNTVFVARTNAQGNILANLDNDPRYRVSYNSVTNTVNLDYSGLDQTQLPAGYYKIVVKGGNLLPNGTREQGITDISGNPLDGTFYGVFPSGFNPAIPGQSGTPDRNFVDFLNFQSLSAPVVTSLQLTTQTDTGIKGDENTNVGSPVFVGQVAENFPGSIQGVTIQAQFSGLHNGQLDLVPLNDRGSIDPLGLPIDITVTTDANGTFRIPAPNQALFLPEGFQRVRIVAIGQPDLPPLAGLSSQFDHAFRIDQTRPEILSATIAPVSPDANTSLPRGTAVNNVSSLSTLSFDVVDPASPNFGPLATPTSITYPALDPSTASNISNYTLKKLATATSPAVDESSFITSANFVATANDYVSVPAVRTSPADAYHGRIDLSIAPGLPAGTYQVIVHTREGNFGGLTDAAGNPLNEAGVQGEGTSDFYLTFSVQAQPVYITSVTANVSNAQGNTLLPYSYYELNPRAGDIVQNPPTQFNVDFSNPIDPTTVNNNSIQLIRTSPTNGDATTDTGDFGQLGQAGLGSTGTGFSVVPNTTVKLVADPITKALTRLVLSLPAGPALQPDHYRLYIPNNTATLAIRDIFHNQLDGEFLGNPSAQGGTDLHGNPFYEDLQPNGQYRNGMSGDGVGGGSFVAGFVVVPTGNLIYARPDYIEDPNLPSTAPDGSIAKPYPVLAPQASAASALFPTLARNSLNNGDPNGGLNDVSNFTSFDTTYDRADLNKFARSAFYAASQLAQRGPVVVVALPGTLTRPDPATGANTQKTFVLQAPAGADPTANDGSASVPFDTTLVFDPGSTLKLRNASLFVQNQGSALQTLGGTNPSDRVTFTSTSDNKVGANPNGPAGNSTPQGGDWGGIVFRNFDAAIAGRADTFPVDGTLVGPTTNTAAISGADDSLSNITFTDIRYAGGAVPATSGTRFDSITLYNSRPMIAQDSITDSASTGATSSQAAISGDLDSFREDDTRRGPLIRRDMVAGNSLNGILIRPDLSGVIETTDAEVYPTNPLFIGGTENYTFDAPLPYILLARMDVGNELLNDTAQLTTPVTNRVYMQPGTLFKFQRGAGIEVTTPGASINVGERTYIAGFDAQATTDRSTGLPVSTYGPLNPDGTPNTSFQINAPNASRVLFTSLYDNNATTTFTDPTTGQVTTIVPRVDSANTDPTSTFGNPGPIDPYQPTPGLTTVPPQARWGSITVGSGAIAAIDQADIRYGGGSLNVAGGTIIRNVLTLFGNNASVRTTGTPQTGFTQTLVPGSGSRVSITNDNFDSNTDAPIQADPNSFLATDPLRPLSTGHPFFHGNVLTNNNYNALSVGQIGGLGQGGFNLTNNSIWDQTDITYLVRGTIVPQSFIDRTPTSPGGGGGPGGVSSPPAIGAITKPSVVLTLQSSLPGTLLPDGTKIPAPGASIVVKLQGTGTGDAVNGQGAGVATSANGGAGFLFGVDNGIDPPADVTIDQGNNSQLRILGIGGNETTGQQRVPVIITSVHDSTVGSTVRGVGQSQVIPGDTSTPAPGDGGVIDFGGNSLTTYNAFDIREGNKIDNADIKYITRIEMQGGGNVDTPPLLGGVLTGNIENIKAGVLPLLPDGTPDPNSGYIQRNAPKELTISNSNLSNFSQVGVLAHPGFDLIETVGGGLGGNAGTRLGGIRGEPNQLFMYNNTISNTPVGVRMVGETVSGPPNLPDPHELLLLNNTFYNNPIGVDVQGGGGAPRAHTHAILMDNIFSNSTTAGVQSSGATGGSVLEYNLYFANGTDVTGGLAGADFPIPKITGDPKFVNPGQGDFNLQEGSAAIDAARSELNLNTTSTGAFVGTLVPLDTQVLDATGGIRNNLNRLPDNNFFNFGGGLNSNVVSNELTLPGYGNTLGATQARGYVDEFIPVLKTDPKGVAGPASNASTFNYEPFTGERDILGNLRQKDPLSPNVGFGSRPFFDIGAFEKRTFSPPHVTGITATVTDPTSPTGVSTINLYAVGTIAGTNKPIQTITVTFDNPIDSNTINAQSVQLEATNGTGSFANPTFYNLSGKLSLDQATQRVLTINVGTAGLTLNNDEYRVILRGKGSNVIRDKTGLALDGQDTLNDNPNNPQLPLPSGSGAPGTDFFATFVVNATAPTVVAGSFGLDPSADSNIKGDEVTKNNTPTFSGNVGVSLPVIEPLAGLTVILDVSTKGNGVFDRLNAGTALTDVNGHFLVTVGQDGAKTGLVTNTNPLPDSTYTVGPDGKLDATDGDDSGYTMARIRVIDPSGNVSALPTDPVSVYLAKNALTALVIDTAPPHITSFSPTPNSLVQPTNGTITFSFTTDKNLDPASLTPASILVKSAGPDGVFGTKDDISFPVSNISAPIYLKTSRLGPEKFTFTITGNLTNNFYAATLVGSGATPITDIAGAPLAGDGTNAGSDFNPQFVVINQNLNLIFVSANATPTAAAPADGTRAHPFKTINAALAVATAGDVVAVLPGLYQENVVLKPFVKLESADISSVDGTLIPGNARQTIIRAPEPAAVVPTPTNPNPTPGLNVTLMASNLPFIAGADVVVSGFSIASPLTGQLLTPSNPAKGNIDSNTAAVEINNANVLLENNYITDSYMGVYVVAPNGTGVLTPRIYSNVIAGNTTGLRIDDQGSNTIPRAIVVNNNDFVYNTIGLRVLNTANSPLLATVGNDIFWQNHDQTLQRNGYGILATAPNSLIVRNSLFQSNGASDTTALYAGANVGNGFGGAKLTTKPDIQGNFTGNPAFVFPLDPRPGSDGPAAFYLGANFDLQGNSVAIDAANAQAVTSIPNTFAAPLTDLLGRHRVPITGKGFPGTGPADVGAFEYKGLGGQTISSAAIRPTTTQTSFPTTVKIKTGATPIKVATPVRIIGTPLTPPPARTPTGPLAVHKMTTTIKKKK